MKDGGRAFPRSDSEYINGSEGMSLRDYFAAAALPVVMRGWIKELTQDGESSSLNDEGTQYPSDVADLIATETYAMAQAMISAREKSNDPT